MSFGISGNLSLLINFDLVVNPRRSCAARVIYCREGLHLCVCVCVCVCGVIEEKGRENGREKRFSELPRVVRSTKDELPRVSEVDKVSQPLVFLRVLFSLPFSLPFSSITPQTHTCLRVRGQDV